MKTTEGIACPDTEPFAVDALREEGVQRIARIVGADDNKYVVAPNHAQAAGECTDELCAKVPRRNLAFVGDRVGHDGTHRIGQLEMRPFDARLYLALVDKRSGEQVIEELAMALCELVGIPPVLHMGSCVDISRMMILVADLAKDWGCNISQLPAVGCAPEWMSEKAVSIGNYVVATGIDTYLGVDPYTKGSTEITELLQGETGAKEWVEAHFVVDLDIERLGDKMIAAIEEKRKALGI